MRGLVELVADLAQRKIEFRSLSDGIDTTTTMGRFTFHLLGAIAEMERDLIRERTNAGLAAARARGRKGGRKVVPDAKETRRRQGSPKRTATGVSARWRNSLGSVAPHRRREPVRLANTTPPGPRH